MLNFAAFSRSLVSFLANPSALEALSLASLKRFLNPRQASRTLRLTVNNTALIFSTKYRKSKDDKEQLCKVHVV